jgi:periplasmic protein TonB
MKPKKTPKADLESKRSVFMQIGMITAIGLIILAFQWKTYEDQGYDLGTLKVDDIPEEIVPITKQEKPPPPPPPPAPVLEIVKDDVKIENELKLEQTEVTQETKIVAIEPRKEEPVEEQQIFTIVERMPAFKGCDNLSSEESRTSCTYNKIQEFLANTIVYPKMASENGITGTVFVTFVIDNNGEVKDTRVLRGIGGGCDEEAVRAVKKMPKWGPGQQRGKPVSVQYNLPVRFTLK